MKKYNIGVMNSGICSPNGADYVAFFLMNAARTEGHTVTELGWFGGPQAQEIPGGLDFIVHSSGACLTSQLVEHFKKKTKVFLWTHNDEMAMWQPRIRPISTLVDAHFSYTKAHPYGDHVIYLPIGGDDTIYYKKSNSIQRYDIGMIGCGHYWRALFVNKIVKIFPNSFFNLSLQMPHEAINQLYNSTKILLAPLQDCDENVSGKAWGCPCRTFDVPTSGAFQIQVNRGGLPDVYPNAVTVEPIHDVDKAIIEWTKHIQYWLDNEELRKQKADEMYTLTMEKHLYRHRLQKMIEVYENFS